MGGWGVRVFCFFFSEMFFCRSGLKIKKTAGQPSPKTNAACLEGVVPLLSLSLSLFPSSNILSSHPYLGLPSKAAISSSSLAATMARDKVWKRGGREAARGDRTSAAAEGELRDSGGGGSLLGAALGLSTLFALAPTEARCIRDADMVVMAESQ